PGVEAVPARLPEIEEGAAPLGEAELAAALEAGREQLEVVEVGLLVDREDDSRIGLGDARDQLLGALPGGHRDGLAAFEAGEEFGERGRVGLGNGRWPRVHGREALRLVW